MYINLTFPKANPTDLKELIKINSKPSGKLEVGKRIRFSIKKDELDGLIKELNEGSIMLSRLCASGTAMYEESTQTASRTSTKLSLLLNRVRKNILSLHSALYQGWKSGCHPRHNIYLATAPVRTLWRSEQILRR